MNNIEYILVLLFLGVSVLILYVGLIAVVGDRAAMLGRNGIFWVLLAIFTTPVIALPLLHCAGETDEHRLQRFENEEHYHARRRAKASIGHPQDPSPAKKDDGTNMSNE